MNKNGIQKYRCPICDINGNKFAKAHILPESLGHTKWTPVVKDKKCECDCIIGTKCVNALNDCNIYNYHNYKKNKKLNISNLQELNKLEWMIPTKGIIKNKRVSADGKMRAKITKKGKYGKLRIQPCPSGDPVLNKKSDSAKATATIQKNAYLVYFCLIHSLLLLDFDKKNSGKRSVLTKRSRDFIKKLLKDNCENKFKFFKTNSANWEYTRDEKFQYILFANEVGQGGVVYEKDKMVSFICGIPTNIKYYVYCVNISNLSISKEYHSWDEIKRKKRL